ncbi:RlpA-like double-psi beta-barrel-protein domain-containing protein-containing protein [Helicostylum pulchrum]|nr:RlpA-like double-psi beta-barrel-protein domain-containing protein-containing protein [Helicostylum pulchrum]
MRLAGAEPQDGYFHGTGTFYDLETRTGTCGKQHRNTEMVAALNAEQMGDSNSSNQNCGKEIEVVGPNGKTITVTVVDSCKTCESGGLDLSPAAYEELGDFSHGSIPIKWKFM